MKPSEYLDMAADMTPGEGMILEFEGLGERDVFAQRLRAAMSAAAREARKGVDASEPNWGEHPWPNVSIRKLKDGTLWVGRLKEPRIRGMASTDDTEAEDDETSR